VGVLTRVRSDEAVIRGFLDGEAAAASQISAWIFEVLRNPRLGLGHDAEDVAQEVRRNLFVAFRDGRFAGHASLRTYVWRVAQHASIDRIRARRAKPIDAAADAAAEPPHPGPSPEDAVLRRERREVFARILASLGEDCRNLFHLIVFEELSYAEIARRLQATEGAIKVRALRCREKAVAEYKSVTSGRDFRPLKAEDV
jgi:RNA polymerase sigma-70 factor, ECF subfamily